MNKKSTIIFSTLAVLYLGTSYSSKAQINANTVIDENFLQTQSRVDDHSYDITTIDYDTWSDSWAGPNYPRALFFGNRKSSTGKTYLFSQKQSNNIGLVANGKLGLVVSNEGKVGLGTNTPNAQLQFDNGIANRKLVLWQGINNDHQFYGFGINSGVLRYQVDGPLNKHIFYSGIDASSSKLLMSINGNGRVGIGTDAPSTKLEIVSSGSRTASGQSISGYGISPMIRSTFNVENTTTSQTTQYSGESGIAVTNGGTPFMDITTKQAAINIVMEVGDQPIMEMSQSQVLIGSNLAYPSTTGLTTYSGLNYTLGVRGRIACSGLTCKDLSQWADYVFDDSYELKPLEAVSDYIAANNHLPDVPSAKEVIEKGIDVSEMLKIQMQKIEELTLYTIEQQKQLKQQQQQISKLTQKLEKL